ncbi:MAG: hypothetical protein AAGA48_07405 [Myxococcota bacterium]
MTRRSPPGPTDLQVSASPREIRRRLLARLLPVRSLWFATSTDQKAWSQAGVPLYVLRHRHDPRGDAEPGEPVHIIETGPRLANLWASCFAPALEGTMTPTGESETQITWRIRWPQPTRVLVLAWWLVLALWAAAIVTGRTEGEPAVFWIFLAVMSTIGPLVGWQFGGQALIAAWPTLKEAIEQPDVGEDW